MNQDQLNTHLVTLERKIKILLGEYDALKVEMDYLKSENKDLKDTLKLRDEHISNFQNQIKISKIAGNLIAEENNTSELKRKIDDYIKEIDKCIAHLSR
ncbi:MAG: hypothetical protein AAFX87_31145 [Bacteroidota bacterium]